MRSVTLQRVEAKDGVVIYQSPVLLDAGFAHAFSTRHGGVSPAPFDTMNLGQAQAPGEPDPEENIARNAARLLAAAGAPSAVMVRVRQVHGADVYACTPHESFGPPQAAADAVVSRHAGVAPCVRTADCVPVLLACSATGAVAAVHAGWRGVVGGVVARAVEHLGAQGAQRLLAAIGPSIGVEAYEVGPEVAAEFHAAGLGAHVQQRPAWPRPHVDCAGAVRAQLLALGLRPADVQGGCQCTVQNAQDFFSYRRDGARSGRMAAVIQPRCATPG